MTLTLNHGLLFQEHSGNVVVKSGELKCEELGTSPHAG